MFSLSSTGPSDVVTRVPQNGADVRTRLARLGTRGADIMPYLRCRENGGRAERVNST